MEQHAIPRQITTFEFKLIGFMTLKQFIYLVIFVPTGYVVFRLFPIPIINILIGIIVALIGPVLAFVPINDRPMEVWIRNFIKRLTSPTQYFYQKNNQPISIFQNLFFVADPHRVMSHIESQAKLASYLNQTKKKIQPNIRKQAVINAIKNPAVMKTVVVPSQPDGKTPFFIGVIKNNRKIPLPGIMVYIKDQNNINLRLLKSNPHGIFATYNSLPAGEYVFEIKDSKETYFFDTLKVRVESVNPKPFEIFSKEML